MKRRFLIAAGVVAALALAFVLVSATPSTVPTVSIREQRAQFVRDHFKPGMSQALQHLLAKQAEEEFPDTASTAAPALAGTAELKDQSGSPFLYVTTLNEGTSTLNTVTITVIDGDGTQRTYSSGTLAYPIEPGATKRLGFLLLSSPTGDWSWHYGKPTPVAEPASTPQEDSEPASQVVV